MLIMIFKPADIVITTMPALWQAESQYWDTNGNTYEIQPGRIFEVVECDHGAIRAWCPSLNEFFAYLPPGWFKKISR